MVKKVVGKVTKGFAGGTIVEVEEMKGIVVWFERVEAKCGNHGCVVLFMEGI